MSKITCDVSIDGGIHCESADTFIIKGYYALDHPTSTLDNEFAIPQPLRQPDGRYVVDALFPALADPCGAFQVDAWWHGGWWGEMRYFANVCDTPPSSGPPPGFPPPPPPPPTIIPLCLVDCGSPPSPPEVPPIPEPSTFVLVFWGTLFMGVLWRRLVVGRRT